MTHVPLQYVSPIVEPPPVGIQTPGSGVIISLCPTDPIFSSLCAFTPGSTAVIIQDIIVMIIIAAIAFALVFLIIGGFRWIMSQGEEESVKKARNTLIAAILGLVIIFLSFFIIALVVHFFLPNFNLSEFELPRLY